MGSRLNLIMYSGISNLNKQLWKIKALFLWYLYRGVVLTKDNLAKINWQGKKIRCFCHREEAIKYLFFQCRLAHSVRSLIHVASNLRPPRSVSRLSGVDFCKCLTFISVQIYKTF